jgi:hypothetical protein
MDIVKIYVMLLGFALLPTVVVAGICWLVEAVLGRRIGVGLGYVTIFAVLLMVARIAYVEIAECTSLFGATDMWPRCEWSPLVRIFTIFVAIVSMPLLIVSEIKLSKWSKNRAARVS